MLQRQSQLFLPTLREDPADAEAVSHRLLVRAGLIRQVSAGLWTYLPAGWRVHERVVQIVREEMDAIGGQEMSMPVLAPAELWEATGRIRIPELFRLTDRAERPVRGPSHGRRAVSCPAGDDPRASRAGRPQRHWPRAGVRVPAAVARVPRAG